MSRFVLTALICLLLCCALQAQPVRLAVTAFGASAEIEVRDLDRGAANAAARAALGEIFELSQLFDPASKLPGSVGALNEAAGTGAVPLDPRVADMLRRSLIFCVWSNGAYGPLGGLLYDLWEENQETRRPPKTGELRIAVNNASCSRLRLSIEEEVFKAELLDGSHVDPRGLARGYAIDRGVEILREHDVDNAWVEIGQTMRALGGGPEGEGWLVTLPPAPGSYQPIDQIWLQDQAITIFETSAAASGDGFHPAIDQRTGVPARGVVAAIAVSELAADAQGLATSLAIIGMRDGQLRLGSLQPRPSVYWLLGEGEGDPVEATYHWSDLKRVRRR